MPFPHPGGGHGGGFGGGHGAPGALQSFGTIMTDIVAGIVFIVILAVVVGLIFLLVRFLVAMTRAADLYVAQNSRAADTNDAAAAQARPSRFPWGDDGSSGTPPAGAASVSTIVAADEERVAPDAPRARRPKAKS